jgi:hypothetical protein
MIEDMTVRNFVEKTRNDYIRHVIMIDVAREVPPRKAVDNPSTVEFEQVSGVASLALVGLLGRYSSSTICRDVSGALNQFRGK